MKRIDHVRAQSSHRCDAAAGERLALLPSLGGDALRLFGGVALAAAELHVQYVKRTARLEWDGGGGVKV